MEDYKIITCSLCKGLGSYDVNYNQGYMDHLGRVNAGTFRKTCEKCKGHGEVKVKIKNS